MAPGVTVYSTPLCIPCEELKRHLTTHGIAFTLVDLLIDEEAADMLEEAGIITAPAIAIDGELIEGFDVERVNALLGL
ncbi:MAG: glutaredoxin domain-containing protein [Dehalococcoidia bacterium]|nr:glutaredoxin domain-containing protein [Dehalococcoidia bacterium]